MRAHRFPYQDIENPVWCQNSGRNGKCEETRRIVEDNVEGDRKRLEQGARSGNVVCDAVTNFVLAISGAIVVSSTFELLSGKEYCYRI